jgi:hypothetical protein
MKRPHTPLGTRDEEGKLSSPLFRLPRRAILQEHRHWSHKIFRTRRFGHEPLLTP